MATPILFIGKDKDALAERAAEFITKTAGDVLHSRESFTIALTGGSTPEQTYRLLARADRSARIDWRRTLVFWGDERFVPPDDRRRCGSPPRPS